MQDKSLTLRSYQQSDQAFFVACWQNAEAFADAFEGELDAFLDPVALAADGLGLYLIESHFGNGPIGACRLQVRDGGRICWLKTLFMLPAYRGKGYGRRAFREILKMLPLNAELLILSVARKNRGALAFWTCMGLSEDQLMTKKLTSAKLASEKQSSAKLASEKQVVIMKMSL